jgi:hypothetical protein
MQPLTTIGLSLLLPKTHKGHIMKYAVFSQDRSGMFVCSGMFNTWTDAYVWKKHTLMWSPVAYIHSSDCFDVDALNALSDSYNS